MSCRQRLTTIVLPNQLYEALLYRSEIQGFTPRAQESPCLIVKRLLQNKGLQLLAKA